MKKRLTALFMAVLCVMMCFVTSCSQTSDTTSDTTEEIETQGDGFGTVTINNDGLFIDENERKYKFITDSYTEYLEHFKNKELPIGYDRGIHLLGTFKYYLDGGDVIYGINNAYLHIVIDEAGKEVKVTIHAKEKYLKFKEYGYEQTNTISDKNNMRTASIPSSYYEYEGITYTYVKNCHLLTISWFLGDLQVSVRVDEFNEYPQNEKTFVGRLLDLDTAPDAVAEFNAEVLKDR